MKGSKLMISLLLVLPALAACNETEEPEMPLPVGFSTTVEGTQTRYASNDLPSSLGVIASQTMGDFNSSSRLNFMYNQKITRAGSTWSYSPAKYWPTNTSDKISFFAYAPYNAAGVALCSSTSQGYPTFTYTVPATEAAQTDLLVAAPVMNQSGGSVNFTLKHTLTKVSFLVKSGDKYAKEVSALSVTAATRGELYFTNGAAGFGWRNIDGTSTFTPTAPTVNLASTDKEKNIATFYLLPTGTVSSTFSITYKVKAADGSEMLTKTITDKTLPDTPAWNAGGSVVYTLNLSEEAVTVTVDAGNSGTWASAGSEDKTVKFYSADDLKVGDYYYSDGTTSDGGLRKSALTIDAATGGETSGMLVKNEYIYEERSPVGGKVCIGIVFYAGQGVGDDVSNYASFGMTQIDGYVVALNNSGGAKWGPTGDVDGLDNVLPTEDLNFNGFANCEKVKALSNYTSYSAFSSAANYGTTRPATKASTWYLPSIAQLRSIYSSYGTTHNGDYRKIVGKNIAKAGGGTFDLTRYWSSTPYSSTIGNYVGFVGGDMNLNENKGKARAVRSILTFQRVTN